MGKRIIFSLVCVVLLSFQANADLTEGLVAYYGFNGNANDSSGNNLNGTMRNGASFARGQLGQALNLDGVNDYVDCGNSSVFNILGEITISAWINPRQGSKFQCIISKCYSRGAQNNPFDFRFNESAQPKLVMVRADQTGHNYFTSAQSLSLNTWYHVAVTVNASGQGVFYVNGQNAGGGIVSITPTGNNHNVYIGRRDFADDIQSRLDYNGLIDEMRIYNRALAQDEIISLYQIPEPATLCLLVLGVFPLLKNRRR